MSLTSVFGMGTGGPSPLLTPTKILYITVKPFIYLYNIQFQLNYSKNGDPYEIRTRVAGVRGRSLRPLDQRAINGAPSGTRTRDTLIKSQVLYQLS